MKRLLLLLALTIVGCPQPGSPPYTPEDPAPEPADTDWCGAAQKNLAKLECVDRAGDPMWVNKRGEGFAEICHTVQAEGRVSLNPRCMAEAITCLEAKECPQKQ